MQVQTGLRFLFVSSAADNLACPVLTLLHGQVELQPWCAERGEANPGWAESAHRTKGARPWSIRSSEKRSGSSAINGIGLIGYNQRAAADAIRASTGTVLAMV